MLQEFISKVPAGDMVAVVAIVLGILAGVIVTTTAIISSAVRRYFERQMAANLIHELLDRGLSVTEIERLVAASAVESPEEVEKLVKHHV